MDCHRRSLPRGKASPVSLAATTSKREVDVPNPADTRQGTLPGTARVNRSASLRSGDIGSPRMSGSTNSSNAGRRLASTSTSAIGLRPPPGRRTRPSGAVGISDPVPHLRPPRAGGSAVPGPRAGDPPVRRAAEAGGHRSILGPTGRVGGKHVGAALISATGLPVSAGFWVITAALLSTVAVLVLRETRGAEI